MLVKAVFDKHTHTQANVEYKWFNMKIFLQIICYL
jgi:hypothetical protein